MSKVTDRRPAKQAFASFLLTGQESIFLVSRHWQVSQGAKQETRLCAMPEKKIGTRRQSPRDSQE
jgi:hypothetical protein